MIDSKLRKLEFALRMVGSELRKGLTPYKADVDTDLKNASL
jgi:hypothetical protein